MTMSLSLWSCLRHTLRVDRTAARDARQQTLPPGQPPGHCHRVLAGDLQVAKPSFATEGST